MGLINLLTNPKNFKFYQGGQGYTGNGNRPGLTNIPYGKDQVGGGSSGQPYIQIPIQQKTTNLGLANNDFILRGGALSTENALYDALRLTKMFGDTKSPNGILFIAKQQILSRTAVRTQTSGDLLNAGGYNPFGTIAQAGIVNIGGHVNKQGNIFDETGAYSNNNALYGVKVTPTQLKAENRLLLLKDAINKKEPTSLNGIILNSGNTNVMSYKGGPGAKLLGVGTTNIRFVDPIGRTGLNNYQAVNPNLKPYFLGTYKKIVEPIYTKTLFSNTAMEKNKGVTGKYYRLTKVFPDTNINLLGTSTDTHFHSVYEPAVEGNTWPKNTLLINNNGTYTYNQQDIIDQVPIKNSYTTTQDFRVILRDNKINQSITTTDATNTGQLSNSLNYDIGKNKTIEGRVNLGNPGNRKGKSYANYGNGVTNVIGGGSIYGKTNPATLGKNNKGTPATPQQLGLDKINSLPVYRSQAADTSDVVNDLVKFRIAIIDNDNPSYKTFIHFRALLDSISDTYSADWNPVQYLGRGEKFYNYNGFTRQLSLSWTVAAQSKQELIPMYKKLNFLASSLAPNYSPNGYMRGNMIQLTIGGYLFEQPGIITGLNYTMDEETPWEIGVNTTYDSDGDTIQGDSSVKELTHIIRVTGFNFIPIHKFRPEVQNPGNQNDYKHFISLANGTGLFQNNYLSVPPVLPTNVIVDTFKEVPKTETQKPTYNWGGNQSEEEYWNYVREKNRTNPGKMLANFKTNPVR